MTAKPERYSLHQDALIKDAEKGRSKLILCHDLLREYKVVGGPPAHWDLTISGYSTGYDSWDEYYYPIEKMWWTADSRMGGCIKDNDTLFNRGNVQRSLSQHFKLPNLSGRYPPTLVVKFYKNKKHKKIKSRICAKLNLSGEWQLSRVEHVSVAELYFVIKLLEKSDLLKFVPERAKTLTEQLYDYCL